MSKQPSSAAIKALLGEMTPAELAAQIARRGGAGAKKYLEALLTDLAHAVKRLESKASHYHRDAEEKLTGFIAEILSTLGHDAECESDNRGHVDLKVSKKKFGLLYLAEAKIHTSYPKNVKGMTQLLTRYSSGKDALAGFLLYIRSPGAGRIIEKWRKEVKKAKALACKSVTAQLATGMFESVHKHSSHYPLTVRHHGVFMHYDPQDAKSPKKGKKKKKKKGSN